MRGIVVRGRGLVPSPQRRAPTRSSRSCRRASRAPSTRPPCGTRGGRHHEERVSTSAAQRRLWVLPLCSYSVRRRSSAAGHACSSPTTTRSGAQRELGPHCEATTLRPKRWWARVIAKSTVHSRYSKLSVSRVWTRMQCARRRSSQDGKRERHAGPLFLPRGSCNS